ncbi:Uncharacterised protein [Candidatus Ornithobacterium hominis]|uniref:hypothetical protein n=1 Tax=Candidatus Ornithobacterium hominis TaxID=2497989 RepID=UPI000E5BD9EF|nr:hypothetical protein [Candidatus Ornithobacterium hominis]SZD72149.1 Uncharacterised protein [Candidatus Ornithobacterium hominis]
MREKLFDPIIESQKKLIQNLEASLETLSTTTDLDEEMTRDLDAHSHQSNLQGLEIETNKKLEMERADLLNIEALRNKTADEVKLGAFIATEKDYYFFGYAFTPVHFEEKKIFGVSPEAPVFEDNLGKKVGDSLSLKNVSLEIKEIY